MDLNFSNIQKFLKAVQNKGCLVVGDIILDKYIYGEVKKISPEAPIPIVKVVNEQYMLGGAANVAGNICGYHVKTYLCGLLGNDKGAVEIKKLLVKKNIEFLGVLSFKRPTTQKTRVIGMNQQLIRIDQEDDIMIDDDEEKNLLNKLICVLPKVQVVILSDYDKGICSKSFCQKLIKLCQKEGKLILIDPKCNDWTKYRGAYLITPNFKEFQNLVGDFVENTEASIKKQADSIIEKYQLSRILITRSQYGMTLVKKNNETLTFQSIQQEVFDVSGAGDTVIATIGAFLAAGEKLENAVEISNYAAGLAVSKVGTYTVTLEEVVEYIKRFRLWYEDKICDIDKIHIMSQSWRKMNERIVFTNGCFDILHLGHIDYLNKARRLGTKLVVGVNSDASVKRLKGDLRPINNQNARTLSLAALQCVDAVVIFDENTPENLIRLIKPDYLVKGDDYQIEEIIGRKYANKVQTIPLVKEYSTTNLIKKIQQI